jgi:hypothetical protein
MKRLLASATLLLILCAAPGCAYRIHVRGVVEPDRPLDLPQGAAICVKAHPDAETQEQVQETARKIAKLLTERRHKAVSPSDADYFLFYEYDREGLMGASVLHPVTGPRTGMMTVRTEAPFVYTLSLSLVDAEEYRSSETPASLWAGGAVLSNTPVRSPHIIDMLLAAAFRYFPKDTGKTVEVMLNLNAPSVRRVRQE